MGFAVDKDGITITAGMTMVLALARKIAEKALPLFIGPMKRAIVEFGGTGLGLAIVETPFSSIVAG